MPEELEPVLRPEGRISVGELVTEELLLSLPIVPLHAGEHTPVRRARGAAAAEPERLKRTGRLRSSVSC